MAPRALLTASATFLGLAGLGLTFLPQELLLHVRQPDAHILVVFVQTIGAAYLAFAILNWMSRGATIGGIYGRPLVVANVLHFTMVAILLVRWAAAGAPPGVLIFAALYAIFALWFGALMFGGPAPRK